VTSPPYWGLRDYGVAGQLGLENTPEEYVARMVEVFHEVRRVLKTMAHFGSTLEIAMLRAAMAAMALNSIAIAVLVLLLEIQRRRRRD